MNNVPVPLGLDQEIACIMRLIAEARARRAAVAPTVAATEKFLARLGAAFPGTVWVGGCKNWYTSEQPTPVLWPLPQSEHKAFFERCRWTISSSSPPGRETDRGSRVKDTGRIAAGLSGWSVPPKQGVGATETGCNGDPRNGSTAWPR